MNPQEPPVSHVDIYHKLGTLEGKLDALITRTNDYKSDIQSAFDRISDIENKIAWVLGGAVVVSILAPIVINIISSNFNMRIEPTQVIHQEEKKF